MMTICPLYEQLVPQVVADPDKPPSIVVTTTSRNQWTDQHKTKVQTNAKTKYLLTYALRKSEYDKIISCDSITEIWDRLQVLHEETD